MYKFSPNPLNGECFGGAGKESDWKIGAVIPKVAYNMVHATFHYTNNDFTIWTNHPYREHRLNSEPQDLRQKYPRPEMRAAYIVG